VTVLRITKLGEEVLARTCEPVTRWDEELERLVADMVETMHAARGVGLAANQVGVAVALAIIDVAPQSEESRLWVLVNPEIVQAEGLQRDEEGCLSIPGLAAPVDRPERVVARFQDLRGDWQEIEGTGLMARALSHEIDHLNGRLFVQRIPGIRGDMVRRRARRMARSGEWEDVHP
jgi:peptide deformylase